MSITRRGIRTAKGTWNGTSCANIASQYLLGRGGEQVTELVGLTGYVAWQHTNVGAGNLMATYDAQGLHFNFTDWLGTKRAQVNADGTIEQTCLSLPFGDALSCDGTGTDATEHHFTGKERDAESGLDYFGARYLASDMGRWMSPDWAAKAEPVPYAKLDTPQSLNLYAYVGNNPLSMADADGHCGSAAPIPCGGESDVIADREAGQEEARNKQAAANVEEAKEKAQPAQQQSGQPAPTNPDGSPKNPGKDVPSLPDGKGPDGKLVPNEWVRVEGTPNRPTKWKPKFPIPGGSQPGVSWDPDGHWDHDNGTKGGRTRWLPGGGALDANHNPVMNTFIKVTVWGIIQAIRFDQWMKSGCGCSQPTGGPAAVPNPQ